MDGYTSVLTWDEVTWVVRRFFGPRQAALQGASFLRFPNVTLIKADIDVLSHAQSMIEEYEIKPRDAIHEATALVNGIDHILTYDKDFDTLPALTRISP